LSQADTVTGTYYRFSQVSFDTLGRRQERIIENKSTLPDDAQIGTTAANNLSRIYEFLLTPQTLAEYDFTLVGRERIDELNTYVFDVQPKIKVPDSGKSGERFFRGRIWVDDQDLCVVKVGGNALPAQSSRHTPKFETYFQNYDRFWFPAYVKADDILRLGGYPTRVIVKAQFTGYRRVKKEG
jgi:hypothetical protein